MSSAGIQKLFCGIYSTFKCSFDEFVGEKVFSPSYSSAILAPPSEENFISKLLNKMVKLLNQIHIKPAGLHRPASSMRLELEPDSLNKKFCVCNVQTIQFLSQALKESGIYSAVSI